MSKAPVLTTPLPPSSPAVPLSVPKMDIFVKFEVWNASSKSFDPVGALMPVDLMDEDPHGGDDLIETKMTDVNGFIQFSVTYHELEQKSGEDKPDLYFKARPQGSSSSGIPLPKKWSTSGWTDKNGKPGLFPNTVFNDKNPLGGASAADPLVYRIGVDYHVSFQYWDANEKKNMPAPKGLKVAIRPGDDFQRTDKDGQLHGLTFDIDAGDEVYFDVGFDIEDPDINLPNAMVPSQMTEDGFFSQLWETNLDDSDQQFLPKNNLPSIGTLAKPYSVSCKLYQRNVALFFLTMLHEHASFFFHITAGAWTGVSGQKFYMTALLGTPYSWPVGAVNINEPYWWDRAATIMHELSHQVMWKELGISSPGIGGLTGDQALHLKHSEGMLANPVHAVVEGWAEIFEGIFGKGHIISSGDKLTDADRHLLKEHGADVPLGPLPVNQGESVEGAFAQGLIRVFEEFVVGKASASANVPRSLNGDITDTTSNCSWVKDPGVQKRFKSAIWEPLHKLHSNISQLPNTRDFLAAMKKSLGPADWPVVVAKLHEFNMAFEKPTITSVAPPSGKVGGGEAIIISGNDFVVGHTTVTIGGHPVVNIAASTGVTTVMTGNAPAGAAGKADVIVTTPVGSVTLPAAYEYIGPTIISISETTGPVDGGQLITIRGTNFVFGNTQVTIGGKAVVPFSVPGDADASFADTTTFTDRTSASFAHSTTFTGKTPAGSAGSPVDVVVTTPSGSATLPGRYQYVATP
jgi:hypothetical protein